MDAGVQLAAHRAPGAAVQHLADKRPDLCLVRRRSGVVGSGEADRHDHGGQHGQPHPPDREPHLGEQRQQYDDADREGQDPAEVVAPPRRRINHEGHQTDRQRDDDTRAGVAPLAKRRAGDARAQERGCREAGEADVASAVEAGGDEREVAERCRHLQRCSGDLIADEQRPVNAGIAISPAVGDHAAARSGHR